MKKAATGWFGRLCLTTLVAVYFLIFVGGVVRSTGSGMGCPDWPKCFGMLVPPTDVSQLPEDYKTIYAEHRRQKNERFTSFLNKIGLNETAAALQGDPKVLIEEDFNAVKTWIEYINRLIGAVIGLLITLVLIFSFRSGGKVVFFSFMAWLFVVITGWFGSIVVSTNLTGWTVSIHLLFALIIVASLTAAWHYADPKKFESAVPSWTLYLAFVLLAIQFFLGTELRKTIDTVSSSIVNRESWVEAAGLDFIIHRSFSWLVLICFGYIFWCSRKTISLRSFPAVLLVIVLGLIFSGMILAYLGFPWMVQPVHLVLGSGLFGVLILFGLRRTVNK